MKNLYLESWKHKPVTEVRILFILYDQIYADKEIIQGV